ncbi:MAG: heavy-metal-associated domain-containing protein [Arthrobacter sp.]|uniref:heavy-metal-associated domain-containing protein n=1 Tax=unclassified Arthrobacter TaxID=235627 RepID=UPI00265444F7|nr:heavy-metal-associated domain-containing protein [Micrococcaceae bacterium]MDN5812663.1 heavy-metal-associated domain-containing protein [Micrococcaceae bacterium]MDN5822999.1 heavy-metal-associated domain-containing protein [Micrococcaceae bacterium]MDN5878693.1 heavy-metal-associated domain-containing protein [Micrococcaceae bacterium]MDN5886217.1 heavy-metal-associated domain-containing protein [Micrococcaceae bacterium]
MSTTISITGMTCTHCVASVTEELSEIEGITGVEVDLVAGGVSTARIESTGPLGEASLQEAVTEAGYALVPTNT